MTWRFDGGLVLLDYQDLDSFDQLSINAGARYRMALRRLDWRSRTAADLRHARRRTDSRASGCCCLQATRPLPDDWRLRVRYRFSDIDGLGGFDGLDGHAP